MRSQLLRSLVYREAGRISRDVEEDATWLTTVERLVVQAIHHRTDVEASITESIVPGELLCISWCTPAEVMNNACAYSSARNRGKTDYIQYTPWKRCVVHEWRTLVEWAHCSSRCALLPLDGRPGQFVVHLGRRRIVSDRRNEGSAHQQ
jgi:hypothetical protein